MERPRFLPPIPHQILDIPAAEDSYGKAKTTGTSHVAYRVAYKRVLEEIRKSL